MKSRKKLVMVMLIMAIALTNGYHVSAESIEDNTEIVSPLYENAKDGNVTLNIADSTATCKAYIKAYRKIDLSITMYLQKKSGTTWVNVKTWEKTEEDVANLSLTKNYTVSKGTYRVRAIMKAGTEIITKTSKSCTKE